jgi:hypothetical protein
MNNLNPLERQLRQWTPRRPSAGLETALFGPAAAPPSAPALTLRWLVPAAACLLLTLTMIQPNGLAPRPGRISANGFLASNQFFCADGGENFWNRVTFDWTKGGQFTSTVRSLTPFWTNTLIR